MTSRCLCAKILNWKSSYDVTLFMCQSRSIIFRGILICAKRFAFHTKSEINHEKVQEDLNRI
jgi:hypothetical protein